MVIVVSGKAEGGIILVRLAGRIGLLLLVRTRSRLCCGVGSLLKDRNRLRTYKPSRRHVTILVTAHANVHIPDGFKCGKLLREGPDESGPDRPPIVGRVVDGVIFPSPFYFLHPTLFHYLLPKPHIAYVCMCVCISPLRTKVSHPSVRRETFSKQEHNVSM